MQSFQYKALKNQKLTSGEIQARDDSEAASKLKEKGLEILSLSAKDGKEREIPKMQVKLSFLDRFQKVKKVEKVFLYKNFATMLKAGLPLTEAIDLLRESINNEKLKKALEQLKYDVEAGNYLSTSLSNYPDIFGTSEIAMLKAGEAGGTLPQSFLDLYEDANSEHQLEKDIKGAMMYPAIILSILLGVSLLLVLFVLPQMTGFFDQADIEVPTITKIIMTGSKLLRKYFIVIAAFLVSIPIALSMILKRSRQAKRLYDKILIRVPWVGKQFKLFYIHKVARMLGTLIKSGVPILQALEITEKAVTHTSYSDSVKVFRKEVKVGEKLSESIAKFEDLYPPFVSRMMKVGDKTGETAAALANISEYYKEELKSTLANISSIIEPILMVCLGAGVAFIAISVLIPMYKIVSGINQMQK